MLGVLAGGEGPTTRALPPHPRGFPPFPNRMAARARRRFLALMHHPPNPSDCYHAIGPRRNEIGFDLPEICDRMDIVSGRQKQCTSN